MTVRFAAARSAGACSPLARALSRRDIAHVANDDGDLRDHERLLHAALREFAAHGLGTVRKAHEEAERAAASGDHDSYQQWHGICSMFDRRLAAELAQAGCGANRPKKSDIGDD